MVVASRRTLLALAGACLALFAGIVAWYVANPFETASMDPRARLFGAVTYRMASAAMAPAIPAGSVVVVDATAYRERKPGRNDIVAFTGHAGGLAMYRVIGLPGDRVRVVDGRLEVNGQPSPPPGGASVEPTYRGRYPVEDVHLAEDEYFLAGDNRDHALDSRFKGPVHRSRLVGRVLAP